jgi:predicted ATPase/DNA-binding SARP family transcriptional activator
VVTRNAQLRFRLLGELEVEGVPRSLLGGPKQRALLGYLLLHANQFVSRDCLVDAVWSGNPPPTARSIVHGYVRKLRAALEETGAQIVARSQGYVLEVQPDELDVRRFEQFANDGRDALVSGDLNRAQELLAESLALWRGEPLADLWYEPSVEAEARRLAELRLEATMDQIDAELELGNRGTLVGELESLVSRHPYVERLRRQQMLALYRAGRQAAALEAYRAAKCTLAEQLGIEPGSELQQLEAAILRQDPTLDGSRRDSTSAAHLPRPTTAFIGRERELNEVTQLLELEETRLITLIGAGGSGKTRLGVEAARNVVGSFSDGVFWIPLAALADWTLVPETVRSALAAPNEVAAHIRGRRALLLVDNFEHVLPAAPYLVELIDACPKLTLLVTSREALKVACEQRYEVPPLREADAIALFNSRARAVDPAFRETPEVSELCLRLDCLPLALELAAARTPLFTPAQVLERVGERLDLLVGPRRADARHHSLRATLDWSYALLDPDEQTLFARLSVFAGGCTYDAAEAVCSAEPDTLQALVEKSLLRHRDDLGDRRYTMLETLREYAAERFHASSEVEAIERLHAEYFLALAQRIEPQLFDANEPQATAIVAREHDNIRRALDWAGANAWWLELRLAVAVARFWVVCGHWSEGSRRLDHALAGAGDLDEGLRRRALMAASVFARVNGEYDRLRSLAEEVLASCGDDENVRAKAFSLVNLATATGYEDDFAHAQSLGNEGVRLALAIGDKRNAGFGYFELADIALHHRRLDEATSNARQALTLFRQIGHHEGTALALAAIGLSALAQGQTSEATEALHEGVLVAAELRFAEPMSWCIDGLAALASSPEQGARLVGIAERLRSAIRWRPFVEQHHAETIDALCSQLGVDRFTILRDEGMSMKQEDAILYATGEAPTPVTHV